MLDISGNNLCVGYGQPVVRIQFSMLVFIFFFRFFIVFFFMFFKRQKSYAVVYCLNGGVVCFGGVDERRRFQLVSDYEKSACGAKVCQLLGGEGIGVRRGAGWNKLNNICLVSGDVTRYIG